MSSNGSGANSGPTAKITLKKTASHRVECGAARYPPKKSTLSGGRRLARLAATFRGKRCLDRMAQRKSQHPLPRDRLFQKMSEVISLREKVAQAELAARVLRTGIDMGDDVASPEKEK
jgi:hypothetical protein